MLFTEVNLEVNGDEIVVSIQEQLPFVEDVICYNVKFVRDEGCYAIAAEPVSFTKDLKTAQDGYIEGVVELLIDMLPKAVLQMAHEKALDIVEEMIRKEDEDREDGCFHYDGGW